MGGFPLFLDCLWGIETKSGNGIGGKTGHVFRLPMRNWNVNQEAYWRAWAYFVFRLPMRNWNLDRLSFEWSSWLRFLDCLWGIETYRRLYMYAYIYEFLDCLWGIETFLKRENKVMPCPFLDCLWGIETGISLRSVGRDNWVFRLPMRNWNEIPTRNSCFIPALVFRLPMRNWNPDLNKLLSFSSSFLDCLWGIETLNAADRKAVLDEFLDCLWGIETQFYC